MRRAAVAAAGSGDSGLIVAGDILNVKKLIDRFLRVHSFSLSFWMPLSH